MNPTMANALPDVQFYDMHPVAGDLKAEVVAGLSAAQKSLPPKFFYDQHGSKLFDQICELPEYYVTRTEIALLERYGSEMAAMVGQDPVLMELGSGSSVKIRTLLDALQPKAYIAMDISREHLLTSACRLAKDYAWLDVHAICVDYSQPWQCPYPVDGIRTAFFPGSSIGNFEPHEAQALLQRVAELVGSGGGMLIGIDLHKSPAILEPAYNDGQGITAAFNKNILIRLNREFGTRFNPETFEHRAIWNDQQSRIEMHLCSRIEQSVSLDGIEFKFVPGESIHTENSYKYTLDHFAQLADGAGFDTHKVWVDDQNLFSIHYLHQR